MIRMEIALFLVLVFIACMYFSAERRAGMLHRTFSALLLVVPVHLIFDAVTIYTVNHLDIMPRTVNDILHRCFIGMMTGNRKQLHLKKRLAIGAALLIELTVCLLQGLHPTWLISGMGLTLMTPSQYRKTSLEEGS